MHRYELGASSVTTGHRPLRISRYRTARARDPTAAVSAWAYGHGFVGAWRLARLESQNTYC